MNCLFISSFVLAAIHQDSFCSEHFRDFWAQAVETGRIAGANAAGDDVKYKPIGSSLVMEVCGTSVFALGTNGKDPDRKFRSEQIKDDVKNTYSKYYYDHGKLVGTILIGDISGMGAAISKMK